MIHWGLPDSAIMVIHGDWYGDFSISVYGPQGLISNPPALYITEEDWRFLLSNNWHFRSDELYHFPINELVYLKCVGQTGWLFFFVAVHTAYSATGKPSQHCQFVTLLESWLKALHQSSYKTKAHRASSETKSSSSGSWIHCGWRKGCSGRLGGNGGAATEEFLDRLGILGKIKTCPYLLAIFGNN